MIDVRVHRNFPLNCIKLIIVVLPAWCPVFCLQVLGMTELLEVLEDKISSSALLVSQVWSELLLLLSRDSSPLALTLLSEHVFLSSNFSTLLVQKLKNSVQNNSCK